LLVVPFKTSSQALTSTVDVLLVDVQNVTESVLLILVSGWIVVLSDANVNTYLLIVSRTPYVDKLRKRLIRVYLVTAERKRIVVAQIAGFIYLELTGV
jgi:hypothetical protein